VLLAGLALSWSSSEQPSGHAAALPLSRVVRAPLCSAQGIAGTIARQRATRNPEHTAAAAASALMTCARAGGFITISPPARRRSAADRCALPATGPPG